VIPDVYVVGVDPGPSTGIFVLRNGARFAVYQGPHEGAISSLASLLATFKLAGAHVHLACERYVSSSEPGRTHQAVPQQVVGQVMALAVRFNFAIEIQTPADAKRAAPNALLRRLGFYVTRGDVDRPDANDANDAARHAVLLLMTCYASVFERLLSSQP